MIVLKILPWLISLYLLLQLDINYRKKWDSHVIRLEKIETDESTGSEVIYWATHFPVSLIEVLLCILLVLLKRFNGS